MKFRPIQSQIIAEVKNAVKSGKTDIFINAPTGVGKSVIALELAKHFNSSYICTHEKMLQAQYERDIQNKFKAQYDKIAASVAGNDTYSCHINGEPFSLGVCKTIGLGPSQAAKTLDCAQSCEYILRQQKAKKAPIAIMNYSYWLVQMNYVFARNPKFAPFKRRELLICDEAHKAPDIIENHFAPTLNKKISVKLENLNAAAPPNLFYLNPSALQSAIKNVLILGNLDGKKKIFQAVKKFFIELTKIHNALESAKEHFTNSFGLNQALDKNGKLDISKMSENYNKLPAWVKQLFRVNDFYKDVHCKFEDAIDNIHRDGLFNLIIEHKDDEKVFHNLSDDNLFKNHMKRFAKIRIYMSATLNSDLLIQRWRLDRQNCHILNADPMWDKNKSPIKLLNTANLKFLNVSNELPKLTNTIDNICELFNDKRGIIHTTTYSITNFLFENSDFADRFLIYNNTAEKINILNNLHKYPDNCILIGPSLTTGVDLYDDFGRFNIICKLSFPCIKNELWAARYKYKKSIYFNEAALILEQAAGRTTRNNKDFSTTYILDSRADYFIKRNSQFFSNSFLKRIVNPKPTRTRSRRCA